MVSHSAAHAPLTAPSRPPVISLVHVLVRIAQIATALGAPGTRAVRLRLDPPALGEIQVHVESSSQGITVRIVTQSHEARALLSDHQAELGRELWRHGLALQSFSASVAGDADGEAPAHRERSPSSHRAPARVAVDPALPIDVASSAHGVTRVAGLDARA
jgi:hypothetical protein